MISNSGWADAHQSAASNHGYRAASRWSAKISLCPTCKRRLPSAHSLARQIPKRQIAAPYRAHADPRAHELSPCHGRRVGRAKPLQKNLCLKLAWNPKQAASYPRRFLIARFAHCPPRPPHRQSRPSADQSLHQPSAARHAHRGSSALARACAREPADHAPRAQEGFLVCGRPWPRPVA